MRLAWLNCLYDEYRIWSIYTHMLCSAIFLVDLLYFVFIKNPQLLNRLLGKSGFVGATVPGPNVYPVVGQISPPGEYGISEATGLPYFILIEIVVSSYSVIKSIEFCRFPSLITADPINGECIGEYDLSKDGQLCVKGERVHCDGV